MSELITELVSEGERIWTLRLIGSVDSKTHHMMWSVADSAVLLDNLLAENAQILQIDLIATDRLDSQGLRLLLNAQKQFSRKKVEIVLKNPNSHLYRLFQIMQFDQVFKIEFDK